MNFWAFNPWKLVLLMLWFATFTPSERVALGAAFLVLVGVIGEYVAEIEAVEEREWLKKAIKRLSMAILVLGLSGDLLGIVMGQAEMAALTKVAGDAAISAHKAAGDAQDAKANADAAKIGAGDAQLKAGTADQVAEAAKLKANGAAREAGTLSTRIQEESALLDTLGPRAILLDRAEIDISRKLVPYAGQKVIVEQCGIFSTHDQDDIEKEQTTWSLFKIVKGAQWAPYEGGFYNWRKCDQWRWIAVCFNTEGSQKTIEAATALGDALKSVLPVQGAPFLWPGKGSQMAGGLGPVDPDAPWTLVVKDPDLIVVIVGDHPAPQQPQTAAPPAAKTPKK